MFCVASSDERVISEPVGSRRAVRQHCYGYSDWALYLAAKIGADMYDFGSDCLAYIIVTNARSASTAAMLHARLGVMLEATALGVTRTPYPLFLVALLKSCDQSGV